MGKREASLKRHYDCPYDLLSRGCDGWANQPTVRHTSENAKTISESTTFRVLDIGFHGLKVWPPADELAFLIL